MALPPLVEPSAPLSTEEVERYARHVLLPDVGMEGQRRLKNARVLVVGAGGLGSPALMYLAAAGVGTIGVADVDVVEMSNLQRTLTRAGYHSSRALLVYSVAEGLVIQASLQRSGLGSIKPEHVDAVVALPGAGRQAERRSRGAS